MTLEPRRTKLFLTRTFSSRHHFIVVVLLGTLGACHDQPDPANEPTRQIIWRADSNGYHTYRIPVLQVTPNGTLLAFSEGRKTGREDSGNIDLIVRRSTDNGQTWTPATIICDQGPDTCGNPAPVVDVHTNIVHLLMTRNIGSDLEDEIKAGTSLERRRVLYARSTDDGQTWTSPSDISSTASKPTWRWYATGPANGIQLQHGPHQGRLVIPANHSIPYDDRIVDGREDLPADYYRSHVVFSDDGGQTWQLGGTHEPYTNESTVVELFDGVLMQNMRSYHGCRRTEEGERVDCLNRRAVATSRNGGISWSPVRLDQTLVDPICQASLFRYSWADTTHPRGILLFSNPASSTSRDHMTVRASFDDGTTWPVHRVIEQGSASYSSLARLPNNRIGLLYEGTNYGEIVFSTFSLNWLLEG